MILPPPKSERPAPRKHLSLDAMISLLRRRGELLPDARSRESMISISDAFMSAFAMFSLKDPSLLAFEARCNDGNMKTLYGIGNVPSDTQMREILDPIKPDQLRPFFNDVL